MADAVLDALKRRFDHHPEWHPGIRWGDVAARLEASPDALRALDAMEATGGEPAVVVLGDARGAPCIVDCAPQSPAGRRSLCYDHAALESRRENPPVGSALAMAAAMGVTPLNEAQYRALQAHGPFDTTTSSWLLTPPSIRQLGGALFGDRRYDTVFTYHNGAQSYYAARGFRGMLQL